MQSKGYNTLQFQYNCIHPCNQEFYELLMQPTWPIFNPQFLPIAASLSCQTFSRLGPRRVLPRCGQLVIMLRQVHAGGTSKAHVLLCSIMDFSYMLLALAAMISPTYAHADCYPSIKDPRAQYSTFQPTLFLPIFVWAVIYFWALGVVICWAINLVGVESTQ